MKQANNVPLSSWQSGTQTEKRRLPSPQHKQQDNSLNKCNSKLFLFFFSFFSRALEESLVPMCVQVYVCSAWHLESKLPQVFGPASENKTWKPHILHLVCIMRILFQEVLIAAIQMMFVFLIEHQGRPMCFSFLVLSAQLFMQNSQISTTKSDSLKMFVLSPFFFFFGFCCF